MKTNVLLRELEELREFPPLYFIKEEESIYLMGGERGSPPFVLSSGLKRDFQVNKNLLLQISLVPLSLFLFILVFVEGSILDISKIIFILLFFISVIFGAVVVFEKIISLTSDTHQNTTKIKKLPFEDTLFLPNISIISPPKSKKAQSVIFRKSERSDNSALEELNLKQNNQVKDSGLISESPEMIAKIIRGWCQDDQ